jgi:nitrate reductase NapE component
VVDVASAKDISPAEAPGTDLGGLPRAGVNLAHWLLLIVALFVLLSVGWIGASEFIYFHWLYAQHSSLQSDDVNTIIRKHATLREFWIKIFQMVLLNVLLPVLTAVLGYTFGSLSDRT